MTEIETDPDEAERMKRICAVMTAAFDVHPEQHETDKVMIFIEDSRQAGIVLHRYDDQFDAMIALLVHLRAIFRANGQDLLLVALDDDGGDGS